MIGEPGTLGPRVQFMSVRRPARWNASAIACAAVVVELAVSANLLTVLGSRYVSEGGTLPEKMHPGSYIAILSAVVTLHRTEAQVANLLWRERQLTLFLLCMFGCVLWAGLFSGVSNLIVLFDNFLPAGCLALAMADAPAQARRRLLLILRIGLAANAALAIGEALAGQHLLPLYLNGEIARELPDDFRPIALYDHPLTGAAATMIGLCLAPSAKYFALRWLYLALLAAGLIAFGGRAALAVTFLAGLGALTIRALAQRGPQARSAAAGLLASPLLLLVLAVAAWSVGIGGRLLHHGVWDASSATRLLQWRILLYLDAKQLMFGTPRPEFLAHLEMLRLNTGVDVIENFALLMFTSLGLGGFLLFLLGFASLLRWCWMRSDGRGRGLVVCFVVVTLASNSLGRKSPLLLLFVAAITALFPQNVAKHGT